MTDRDADEARPGNERGEEDAGEHPLDEFDGDHEREPEAERASRGEEPEEHSGDIPLSGLREDIEQRRRERSESKPEAEEAFEEVGTDRMLDGEKVWEDLLASQADEAGVLAFGEAVEGESEDVRVIPDRICHSCKYFGDPPELHCTHDGTEIRRVADMDHYEVVDCPVVKNRSDLRGE